jgi:hypothetical protein
MTGLEGIVILGIVASSFIVAVACFLNRKIQTIEIKAPTIDVDEMPSLLSGFGLGNSGQKTECCMAAQTGLAKESGLVMEMLLNQTGKSALKLQDPTQLSST